jgi:hypothetical protein
VDDVDLDAAGPQPAGQPEAVAASLESHGDTRDLAPGLTGLLAPALQLPQQARLVHGELLQRVALQARDDGRDEPARLAHLDDRDQRAVGVEGGAAPARVVRHWHGGLHRLGPAAMVLRLAVRPIASRIGRRDDENGR